MPVVTIPCNQTVLELRSLHPASEYDIIATWHPAIGELGPPSDAVVHRTAAPNTTNLTAYRISELCGGGNSSYSYDSDPEYFRPVCAHKSSCKPTSASLTLETLWQCEPDYLADHDSGSLLADMEFIQESALNAWHVWSKSFARRVLRGGC